MSETQIQKSVKQDNINLDIRKDRLLDKLSAVFQTHLSTKFRQKMERKQWKSSFFI